MGTVAFASQPSSEAVQQALRRVIDQTGTTPRHIICDRGGQFDCDGFREWCEQTGIQPPRYGKAHKHGSIAVVERFNKTLKYSFTKRILVSSSRTVFLRQLALFVRWYNEHRPHERFHNRLTPQEVYDQVTTPSCLAPRFEPRARMPIPQDAHDNRPPVRGSPGVVLDLSVRFLDEEEGLHTRLLPVIALKERAAS